MMKLKYKEDWDYFKINLDFVKDEIFNTLFDDTDSLEKRKQYNIIKKQVYKELMDDQKGDCYLNIDGICNISSGYQIDHIIPLTTNILNKKLRNMKSEDRSKKVPSESYGSNHINNLILTCKSCNQHKKHRLLNKKEYQDIFIRKGLLR